MAIFTVTNLNESGPGSLRDALQQANTATGADEIVFQAGLTGTLTLTSGQLTITDDVTIDGDTNGDNRADITISGDADGSGTATAGDSRIFNVAGSGTDTTLLSLTMTRGFAGSAAGGAIVTGGGTNLVFRDSTISNSNSGRGGGVYIDGASDDASTLVAINSTFSGNSSGGNGGAIYADQDGSATLTNVTLDGNSTEGNGGGVFVYSPNALTVTSSTITNNSAGVAGGGIALNSTSSSTLTITNSVVAGNAIGPAGISGTEDVRAASGATFTATNSFFGTNVADIDTATAVIQNGGGPLLGALADNGGTVQTRAILQGSPLIGKGNAGALPADKQDIDGDTNVTEALPLDANGNVRVIGALDIGAAEYTAGIVVDTLSDIDDGNYSAGNLSVREALQLVSNGGTINFASGIANGSSAGVNDGVIRLTAGQLELLQSVTIDGDVNGDGMGDITISGDANGNDLTITDSLGNTITDAINNTNTADNSRVFEVNNPGDAAILRNLVITGGNGNGFGIGGGISAQTGSALSLFNVSLSGNGVTNNGLSNYGGGLHATSSNIVVDGSLIEGNRASYGGGIFNNFSNLTINRSTIANNSAENHGGGIFSNTDLNTLTTLIVNSTLFGNSATDGGGIANGNGRMIIQSSTIAGNSARQDGGGVWSYNDTLTLTELDSVIVAENTAVDNGADVAIRQGTGTNSFSASPGNNLIGDGNGLFTNGVGGNIVGSTAAPIDPGLTASGDNGGPLPTMALLAGSLAIDAGANPGMEDFDARGGLRTINGLTDIGAVEFAGPTQNEDILFGTLGNDTINGLAGNDTLHAGAGDDTVIDGFGLDVMVGGAGTDTLSFAGQERAVIANLATGQVQAQIYVIVSDAASTGASGAAGTTLAVFNAALAGNIYFNLHTIANPGGELRGQLGAVLSNTTVGAVQTVVFSAVVLSGANEVPPVTTNASGTARVTMINNSGTVTYTIEVYAAGISATEIAGAHFHQGAIGATGPVVEDILADSEIFAGEAYEGNAALNFENIIGGNLGDSLAGDGGANSIAGGLGNDTLLGNDGNDTLEGGDGNDFIGGGAGNDAIDGGAGNNTIFGGLGNDTVQGGEAYDEIYGSAGRNQLFGNGGNDFIQAGSGGDFIGGGGGNDTVRGGDGADTVYAGLGNDNIGGGAGNDVIFGSAGANVIYAGLGNDTVQGGSGSDTIFGSAGVNQLFGDDGNDSIQAGSGGDFIGGGGGNDTVRGGDGADTVYAGLGNDNIGGGAGNDVIFGSAGANVIYAGLGNDTVQGGSGSDTIFGSAGVNKLFGNDGNDVVYTSAAGDLAAGGAGNDSIFGSDGNDTIFAGLGDDFIGGGAGNDAIFAGAGANRIYGGVGNDTITAGVGKDVVTGGPGADAFVFASAAAIGIGAARDVITDFTPGVDDIDLRALGTTFNGTAGLLGGGAESFFYFAAGGLLIGDQTGDGAADWVLELAGAPGVGTADFLL